MTTTLSFLTSYGQLNTRQGTLDLLGLNQIGEKYTVQLVP